MRSFFIILVVLFLGGPLATVADDKISPESIQGAETVAAVGAKKLLDSGAVFVDVRKTKDWKAGRISGAIHLELKNVLCEHTLGDKVKIDQKVVFYCNGPKCMRSSKAVSKAIAWGYSDVYYFRRGFPAWSAVGYPVE